MIRIDIEEDLWRKYQEVEFKMLRYKQMLNYIHINQIQLDKDIHEFYMIAYALYVKEFKKFRNKLAKEYTQGYGPEYKWSVYSQEPFIVIAKE